jgi:adenylate cyclase
MIDEDPKTKQKMLWSRVASGIEGVIQVPLEHSIVGDCVMAGKVLNVREAYQDARFNPNVDQQTGYKTHSVLAVPVRDKDGGGTIIGAIQMLNKKDEEGEPLFVYFCR